MEITITTAATLRGLQEDAGSVASALRVAADYADLAYARESGPTETDLETVRSTLEIARRVASRLAYHIQQTEDALR